MVMEDVHSAASPHPQEHQYQHQHQHHNHNHDTPTTRDNPNLNHHLIHLIQCSRCSLPLRTPLRLPCGNTICRECLPPTRPRTRITYPASEGRDRGFECYFSRDKMPRGGDCVGEHCVGDCGADVLMTGLVGVFEEVLGSKTGEGIGEKVKWWEDQESREAVLQGGRLGGIYGLVKDGRIGYEATDVQVQYPDSGVGAGEGEGDEEGKIFGKLTDAIRTELDCHVCYSLILDPLTTPCGHTFCRRCVAGILNHSDLCPICRRKLNMLSNLQVEPANKRVAELIEKLFPDQITARREALAREDPDSEEQKSIPLFVCTLSFPGMPTFLHVYERRYRIMMRRVMELGAGRFGMVAYNRGKWPQGDMGRTPFMEYGTLLQVERLERLPDGRSLVIAKGVSRFRVTKSERNEGYHVGRTDRVDDVSLMEEEALESREVSNAGTTPLEDELGHARLEAMSTQELFELGMNFVRKQRKDGARWLHPRVLMAYGGLPTDPAQFPWWLASVLPVPEEEKYALLSTTSVRERLKITARWVRTLEARRWYVYISQKGGMD